MDINNPAPKIAIPEMDEKGKNFLAQNRARSRENLNQYQNKIISGVDQSANLGAQPFEYQPEAISSALQNRMATASARDMEKIKAQANVQGLSNRSKSVGSSLDSDQFLANQALKKSSFNISEDDRMLKSILADADMNRKEKIVAATSILDEQKRRLRELQNRLQDGIDQENQRRKEEAARNEIISSIVGGVGMVAGGAVGFFATGGNPMGAMAGASAGSQLGNVVSKGK
jgi:hypothetical protein